MEQNNCTMVLRRKASMENIELFQWWGWRRRKWTEAFDCLSEQPLINRGILWASDRIEQFSTSTSRRSSIEINTRVHRVNRMTDEHDLIDIWFQSTDDLPCEWHPHEWSSVSDRCCTASLSGHVPKMGSSSCTKRRTETDPIDRRFPEDYFSVETVVGVDEVVVVVVVVVRSTWHRCWSGGQKHWSSRSSASSSRQIPCISIHDAHPSSIDALITRTRTSSLNQVSRTWRTYDNECHYERDIHLYKHIETSSQ